MKIYFIPNGFNMVETDDSFIFIPTTTNYNYISFIIDSECSLKFNIIRDSNSINSIYMKKNNELQKLTDNIKTINVNYSKINIEFIIKFYTNSQIIINNIFINNLKYSKKEFMKLDIEKTNLISTNNITKPILNTNPENNFNIENKILDKKEDIIKNNKLQNVYIICNNEIFETDKYLNDLIYYYAKNNNFILLDSKNKLENLKNDSKSILIIYSLYTLDIVINDLIKLKMDTNCINKIVLIVNNFYWLNMHIRDDIKKYELYKYSYLLKNFIIAHEFKKIITLIDDVIFSSNFIYKIYSKYIINNNFKIIYNIDNIIDYTSKNIPIIIDNNINICVLHIDTIVLDKIKSLFNKYKIYNINWYVNGENINNCDTLELFDHIKKYNLHGIVYLNNYGEALNYSLTNIINSGLSLIYNNFGIFKELIPNNIDHYFKLYNHEHEDDEITLIDKFNAFFDFIINNNGKFQSFNNKVEMKFDKYYNDLLKTNIYNSLNNHIINIYKNNCEKIIINDSKDIIIQENNIDNKNIIIQDNNIDNKDIIFQENNIDNKNIIIQENNIDNLN